MSKSGINESINSLDCHCGYVLTLKVQEKL